MKIAMLKAAALSVFLIICGCAAFHPGPFITPENPATMEQPRGAHATGSGNVENATADIDVTVLAKTTKSWDGGQLPPYPSGRPEITILRIRVQPGVSLAMHKHSVINAGVLIEGRLTVVAEDGATLHLNAGDGIVELVDKWHYGRNDGETPADIIVFYAGTADDPVTIHKPH
jgi:quercetin dioxygenase-like cupin family protein